MDSRRFELQKDIDDIDRLLNASTRDNSKQILVQERMRLSSELSAIPAAVVNTPVEGTEKLWKPIDKFAWEQTDDEVKIYVTCFSDFKSLPKSNLILESASDSVCVSIVEFNGVNYRLRFPKLNKDIKDARTTLKSSGFSLTLKKKERGHWDAIAPKAPLIKKKGEEDSKGDSAPGDSLMNMMKNLYEEGDDDMKRTIAEAWSKSKDKPAV